jgi:replicative DNA helicase
MPEGRIPPYNEEAERAVLGSVLLNNDCWREVYSLLNADDFYNAPNRIVFEKMFKLFGEGVPVDPVTLGYALKKENDLEKIGGAAKLSSLLDSVASSSNVAHYAGIVIETSALRKIVYKSQQISALGYNSADNSILYKNIDELVAASLALQKSRMPMNMLTLGQKVLDNYRLVADGYRGIKLPWKSIDDMTAGLWPKTVTMFVARPNLGKTSVCVICGRYAWMNGKKVLIISPEMSKVEMAERFFVLHGGIPYHNVILGTLSTQQETHLEKIANELKVLDGIYIMDSEDDISPCGIDAAILACNPDMVAVDAIYRLKMPGTRQDRATAAMEWLGKNCQERGYTAVGFGQMNRGAEQSEKKGGGIRLGTIAMTDDFAQDAQNIFALEQSQDDKDDNVMKIKPLKIRRGKFSKKSVRIHWDFDCMNFEEIDAEESEENEKDPIPF